MAYKITYDTTDNKITKRKKRYILSAVGVLAVGLAVLIRLCYPGETRQLTDALFPLTSASSQQALKTFSENIRAGESFEDAVAAFCMEIIDETNIS